VNARLRQNNPEQYSAALIFAPLRKEIKARDHQRAGQRANQIFPGADFLITAIL